MQKKLRSSTHAYKNQKFNSTLSRRGFTVYFRDFIENINNSRNAFFLGNHYNLEFLEFELRSYRSYCQLPSCDRIVCRNSCKVWDETKRRCICIQIKRIVKMYIPVCSFSKSKDAFQKFWVSEITQKKSLQKHLKSGTCWKSVTYYPAFLYFTE